MSILNSVSLNQSVTPVAMSFGGQGEKLEQKESSVLPKGLDVKSCNINDREVTELDGIPLDIYKNAKNPDLNMLAMGRMDKLGEQELKNFMPTSESSSGSILRTDNWSLAANDAWIMGGINKRKEFHLAATEVDASIVINKDSEFLITVTGRELLGLAAAGYFPKDYQYQDLSGMVLTCRDYYLASTFSTDRYTAVVDRAMRGEVNESDSDFFCHLVALIQTAKQEMTKA